MSDDIDVLLLRRGVHGIPTDEYAAALRERLPDVPVRLARTPADERSMIESATVVSGLDVDEPLLDRAGELKLFAGVYAGTDHLPLDRLAEAGVTVTNASGVHGPNVSEHAIGAVLSFALRFREGRDRQDRREWRSYRTNELYGSTVTVVGMGDIGTAVLERLDGFGVETVGVRHSPEKGGPADEVVGYDAFQDVLARTEYLILACPLTPETRELVDEAAFETLPSSAVLVNVARGPVVSTDALVAALRSHQLRGASLDVTDPEPLPADHPLWTFENVQITPHNAGHTPAYYQRLADIVAANVEALRDGVDPAALRNVVVTGD
ncbi:D-2-hydroxyacid dehydrogenase [Halovivax limisalsi]|uniref:D-2-hydroxyacid dehydrogenase n=1 Tax=Halovivax limisalsi TaxID=1453760 RepID=UPI001FFC7EF5|nr:D-2-hydroxyacid dehydrogenase [Halovivax limisalsi]